VAAASFLDHPREKVLGLGELLRTGLKNTNTNANTDKDTRQAQPAAVQASHIKS
jgi:hypothetical protein